MTAHVVRSVITQSYTSYTSHPSPRRPRIPHVVLYELQSTDTAQLSDGPTTLTHALPYGGLSDSTTSTKAHGICKRPPYANTKVYDVMKRLAADISRDLSSVLGHGNTIYHSVSRTKQRRQSGLHSGTYKNLRR